MKSESREKPVAGWILYDGSCGICRRWVPFWEKTLRERGFAVAALQEEWVKNRLRMGADSEVLQDIRLLFPDGRYLAGAEVYRYAMSRIWWAYPLYALSVVPIFSSVFDRCYRGFAAHRHSISRFCGLGESG